MFPEGAGPYMDIDEVKQRRSASCWGISEAVLL